MRRLTLFVLTLFVLVGSVEAASKVKARAVSIDTNTTYLILSGSATTVQQAIEELDEFVSTNELAVGVAANVTFSPSGLTYVTGTNLQDVVEELDAAISNAASVLSGSGFTNSVNINTNTLILPGSVASGEASGSSIKMTVDVNAQGFGAPLFVASDGNLETADATTNATLPCIALAIDTGTGADKEVLLEGIMAYDSWSWTQGSLIYVSTNVGTLTQTIPSGSGDNVQIIGVATDTNALYFTPNYMLLQNE